MLSGTNKALKRKAIVAVARQLSLLISGGCAPGGSRPRNWAWYCATKGPNHPPLSHSQERRSIKQQLKKDLIGFDVARARSNPWAKTRPEIGRATRFTPLTDAHNSIMHAGARDRMRIGG